MHVLLRANMQRHIFLRYLVIWEKIGKTIAASQAMICTLVIIWTGCCIICANADEGTKDAAEQQKPTDR